MELWQSFEGVWHGVWPEQRMVRSCDGVCDGVVMESKMGYDTRARTWEGPCSCYNGRHWSQVCIAPSNLAWCRLILFHMQDCCCIPIPRSLPLSWRAQVQAVDQRWLQGSNEGKRALQVQLIEPVVLIWLIRYICWPYQSTYPNRWWNAWQPSSTSVTWSDNQLTWKQH